MLPRLLPLYPRSSLPLPPCPLPLGPTSRPPTLSTPTRPNGTSSTVATSRPASGRRSPPPSPPAAASTPLLRPPPSAATRSRNSVNAIAPRSSSTADPPGPTSIAWIRWSAGPRRLRPTAIPRAPTMTTTTTAMTRTMAAMSARKTKMRTNVSFVDRSFPRFSRNPRFRKRSSFAGADGEEEEGAGPLSELAAAVRAFGEGFVKMENMKMEMMRETEKNRMEMERKRTELILESQRRIAESIAEVFSAQKKAKKSSDS